VHDSLDHIFKCIGDNAQLSKWSGGIGTDWTDLRGTGAHIKGTDVESQGVIPFLRIANDTTVAINRSGKRRGATCAYLETWHIDIEDFLELRKNTGDERRRTPDMNTSNWIPDLFFKRIREDGDWTLFSPEEVSDLHHIYGKKFEERYVYYEEQTKQGKIKLSKTLKAKDLWKKMLAMLFETGHPWITFKDSCNIRSPKDHVGVIHNSNLCTEITLNTSEEETAVCNLGSVNLSKHIKDKKLDQDLMRDTVTTAMRMLDNVIDVNFYPTVEAQTSNFRHRPVGLGIMGFQDALYELNISFESDACINFADESMELVSYHAISASANLAKERGAYESYTGSKWNRGIFPQDTIELLEKERGIKIDVNKNESLDWSTVRRLVVENGMRNSNCLAIAPTATISNIAGCFPCIEPIYKNIYVKANASGDFTIINSYLVDDLKELKLWDFEMLGKVKYNDGNIQKITEIPQVLREKYKEVFEVHPKWLIKIAAHRGKWIDQSQSLNLYFAGSSGKELNEIYQYAWEMGLKTTYYLRTLAVSQVEKSTVSIFDFGVTHLRQQAVSEPAVVMSEPVRIMTAENISETNFPQTVVTNDQIERGSVLKLCKILEPSCEACQ
jgi:ribonucleoside-diphosphate reductase alpha chain